MKLPGIIFFCILSFCAFAFENLGSLDKAREKYPEIFIPGSLHKMKIDGKESYVFAGQAEQLFSKKNAETDSELYQEATLAAKNFFYQELRGKKRNITVTMSECGVLYRFREDKVYTVILFVPVENVTITETEEPEPVAEEEKPAAEEKPVAEEKKPVAEEKKEAVVEEKKPASEEKPAAEEKKEAVAEEKKPASEEKPVAEEKKPVAEEKKEAVAEDEQDRKDISQEEKAEESDSSASSEPETRSDDPESAEEVPERTIDEEVEDIMKSKDELDSFFDTFFK